METGWVEQGFARDNGEMADQKGQGVVHQSVPKEVDGGGENTVADSPKVLRQSWDQLLGGGMECAHLSVEARSADMGSHVDLSGSLYRLSSRCSSFLKGIQGGFELLLDLNLLLLG
jgi:hypothetical protein